MNQMWQIWYTGASDETVNSIIQECETYPVSNATVGDTGSSIVDNQYRQSDLRWIDSVKSSWIKDILWNYAEEANRNAFGFDINYLKEIQYTTYRSDNNGKYDWHCDTFWANSRMFDRKLSIVMQLSDGNDYEGGDFQFDSGIPAPDAVQIRNRGVVIVFPSFLSHRVTPVTQGVRNSLVAWIEGPKFR